MALPEDLIWAGGHLKQYLLNLLNDPSGPFANVDARARALMKEALHHRNRTGEIFPGVDRLAFELPFKARSIRYGFGRLCAGPSRQRDGKIVDGLGLMWRARRWNPWGGQTSNAYGFTRKFFEMAGVVLPPAAPEVPAPVTDPAVDQDYAVFAAVFSAERSAKYSGDAGTLRADNRAKVASYVLDLTAEAFAWAQGRGIAVEWSSIREDLCRRMVREWLEMPGTNGFLNERRHPIGLIVGDLPRLGPDALAAWKRVQPKIHAAPPPQAPPPELPAAPVESAAEVQAICAELLGRLSPLDPAVQHDATWSAPAAPAADDLAVVRAKAAEIAARGGSEAARPRAMSVLLAERARAEDGDDPAGAVAPELHRGRRRSRSSVALFLPGVVPPTAEEELEEPEPIGEERQGEGEGEDDGRAWSQRTPPPYTPRSRRRGS